MWNYMKRFDHATGALGARQYSPTDVNSRCMYVDRRVKTDSMRLSSG